jgi:hypothetical protein
VLGTSVLFVLLQVGVVGVFLGLQILFGKVGDFGTKFGLKLHEELNPK